MSLGPQKGEILLPLSQVPHPTQYTIIDITRTSSFFFSIMNNLNIFIITLSHWHNIAIKEKNNHTLYNILYESLNLDYKNFFFYAQNRFLQKNYSNVHQPSALLCNIHDKHATPRQHSSYQTWRHYILSCLQHLQQRCSRCPILR